VTVYKAGALAVAAVLFAAIALAQDTAPKYQVFGGYSLLHADTEGVTGPTLDSFFSQTSGTFHDATSNYNGWNAEAQVNIRRWLGAVADFSGYYGSPVTATSASSITGLPSANSYTFMFGPVVSFHSAKFTPFVHALFGANRFSSGSFSALDISNSISDTAFAMALGGGVDYHLTRRWAWRIGQVDYLYSRHDANLLAQSLTGENLGLNDYQNNIRFSTGLVFHFGK
jgi:opacity protein-like surface antigen